MEPEQFKKISDALKRRIYNLEKALQEIELWSDISGGVEGDNPHELYTKWDWRRRCAVIHGFARDVLTAEPRTEDCLNVHELAMLRAKARQSCNFSESDRLRDLISGRGYTVTDCMYGRYFLENQEEISAE